jgi:ribosome biogenesis GTPase
MQQPGAEAALSRIGWTDARTADLPPDTAPARVSAVHRSRLTAIFEGGARPLATPSGLSTGDIAVGDWIAAQPDAPQAVALLPRATLLSRRAAGRETRDQLIAANVDTAFLTTSANADFNEARLERLLALVHQGGVRPVILLTKADLCPDPGAYLDRIAAIAPDLTALALTATDPASVDRLAPWTGPGQTVCFLGTSGVGKSTLAGHLARLSIETAPLREADARGRHTTTARTLYPLAGGGCLIDTPGMRELRLPDVAEGLEATFADVTELATRCRFRDCAHEAEPGCAVQEAIAEGRLDPVRLDRWRKLQAEDRHNAATAADLRAAGRRFGRMVRDAGKHKRRWDATDE